MGSGSYTSADWAKLKKSGRIADSASASQIFTSRDMPKKFNPRYINKRESRDNDEHPNSTPVIIGLDVTGSMGYLAEEIAKNSLNETMLKIYSTKPIEDPQLMFAAIGDVNDRAPLQVTQFESDIRIAEQLLELWLEGCGGDGPEDYPLLWYFAARHTSTDCYEKRGKKGFLFTIGDADSHSSIQRKDLMDIFDDTKDVDLFSTVQLAKEASEKYELFHIHLNDNNEIPEQLNQAIPGRILVLPKDCVNNIPELIITALLIAGGMDREEAFRQLPEMIQPTIRNAFARTVIENRKGIAF